MYKTIKLKAIIPILLFIGFSLSISAQGQPSKKYTKQFNAKTERTGWFRDARFGMFIHYGPYAVPARGEWVKSVEKMTNKEYQKYVDAFVPSNYNPTEWALIAKQAGMKYAVMTAKHHDGFCMYDSKLTDYKITTNLPGRDFIKEFTDSFRAQELKMGLYYS